MLFLTHFCCYLKDMACWILSSLQWFSLGLLITFLLFVVFIWNSDSDFMLFLAEKFGKKIGKLQGKVVWITGASSGIGEALAVVLATNGVKLVLSARREAELQRVKKRCLDAAGLSLDKNDVLVLPMDVTELGKHQELFDSVIASFGQLDILVNNAGRSQRASWESIDIQVDRDMFELDVFSAVNLSRIAVKYFLGRQEGGHVAVMSSIAGKLGLPFSATYGGAKYALHGYFESLRTEQAGGKITVTLFCPGPVFSNFLSECFTAESGKKFGKPVEKTDKRMDTSRCAKLCAVALANRLDEAWMALPPWIAMIYANTHCSFLYNRISAMIGSKRIMELRDTKNTMEKKSS